MGFNRFGGGRGGGERRGGSGGYGGRREGGFGGGRDGGFGGAPREAPVHAGEEYDLEITDVSQRGEGIARVNGFIIFVAGSNKGDKLRIRIKDVRRRFAVGEVAGASTGAASAGTEEAPAEESEETEEEASE